METRKAAAAEPEPEPEPQPGVVADDRAGSLEPVLVQEYGVVHLKSCLSEHGQRELWRLTQPHVSDPAGKATGFSGFSISRKGGKGKRVPAFDEFGSLVFGLCAEALSTALCEEDCAQEPSYQRLRDLAQGRRRLQLDEIFGNYYRADATLLNHVDSDNTLLSMSVAMGDDCEFVIGAPTPRTARMSERSGKARTIRMASGDAVFFDGGSVPHQVKRVVPGTAPSWWEASKVPNGARCVVLFREREEGFYKGKIQREGKKGGRRRQAGGAPK